MKPGEAASDLLANSITRAPPPAPPNSRTTTSIASWHAFDVGASQHIPFPFPCSTAADSPSPLPDTNKSVLCTVSFSSLFLRNANTDVENKHVPDTSNLSVKYVWQGRLHNNNIHKLYMHVACERFVAPRNFFIVRSPTSHPETRMIISENEKTPRDRIWDYRLTHSP